MKLRFEIILAVAALAFNAGAQPGNPPPKPANIPTVAAQHPPAVMPDADTLGTALGVYFGEMSKRDHFDINADLMAKAIKDVVAGQTVTNMDQRRVMQIMNEWQAAVNGKRMAERAKLADANKGRSEAFLATNAKAPGVITLSSGIQYKVLAEGSGPTPEPTNIITVNYKASLLDGTVFDQNDHFASPARNPNNRYKCWMDFIPLMKAGSKFQVFVPPDKGMGLNPPMRTVPPNSVLMFDVEMLSITSPAPAPAPAAATTGPVVSGQIIKVPSAEEMKKGAKIEVITNVPNSK